MAFKNWVTDHRWMSAFRKRTNTKVALNLGTIKIPKPKHADKMFRNWNLETLDAYYDGRQYDHLTPWNDADKMTPLKDKAPLLNYNMAKNMTQRLAAKLVGDTVFPQFAVEEDPITEEYFKYLTKATYLKAFIKEPTLKALSTGSSFLRFYVVNSKYVFECYESKHCYPEFDEAGDLESISIKYIYEDKNDRDEYGTPKQKWYRLDCGKFSDVLYNNPEFKPDEEPIFQVVDDMEHGFGFVQGQWFKTTLAHKIVDGPSIYEDILAFIDVFNYQLSQSSHATSYNLDPQLIVTGLSEEELDSLFKSSEKAWNLGREGKASYLESNLNGVQVGGELRDKLRLHAMDLVRVVLMDPEKVVAHAQSGRALEILHGPMVDLINELRPIWEKCILELLTKINIVNLVITERGYTSPITMPEGFLPSVMTPSLIWPPVFQATIEDMQKKVQVTSQAVAGFLISEETGTKFVAKDFGVENIEEERAKIAATPVRNPFGGF